MKCLVFAVVLAFLVCQAAAVDVEVGFSRPTFSTQEGGPFRICLVPTNVNTPLSEESFVTLDRSYEFGSATFMDNVTLPVGFGDSVLEVCVDFTAVDNDNLDNGNTISVKIMDAGVGVEISADCQAEVEVSDDEIVEIGFAEELYEVDEDDGNVTVCLELGEAEGELRRAVQVLVFTVPHNDSRVAFETLRRIVTFPIGSEEGYRACFDVVIIDDSDANNDTYFSVIGEEEDLNVRFGFAANDGSALVIVRDDDIPPCPLEFVNGTPSVDGNNVSVSLAAPCEGLATCELEDGDAIVDSGPCSDGLMIPPGETGRVNLRVTLDNSEPLEREVRTDNTVTCDAHLINVGVTINSNGTATFEFEGTGISADFEHVDFRCSDFIPTSGQNFVDCTSPYTTAVLDNGDYTFRARAVRNDAEGCGRSSRDTLRVPYTIGPGIMS